jgi:hypothetical protein
MKDLEAEIQELRHRVSVLRSDVNFLNGFVCVVTLLAFLVGLLAKR